MATAELAPQTRTPVAAAPQKPGPSAAKPSPERLVSLDAYRGFIMLTMASAGLALASTNLRLETTVFATNTLAAPAASPAGPLAALGGLFPQRVDELPASKTWHFLGYQFEHVPWVGCSFWDLIQPSFMFMVGVAIPYSIASRRAKGESYGRMLWHAVWRAGLLILLAVFLSSPMPLGKPSAGYQGSTTNWIFVNVLAQIGMGYVFVFLLAGRGWKVQFGALALILVGYTLFFGLWPRPEALNPQVRGVPEGWAHDMTGWFAGWNKNANAAHDFDVVFLNLFPSLVPHTYSVFGLEVPFFALAPRPEPFVFNAGGYQTLNFVPSMATMILGLMAGEMLRSDRTAAKKFALLGLAGCACLAVGWLMGLAVCPIVKRIWTPSWAVFSAGWTFAILALFYGVIDVLGWRRWAFPLVVVGMNSIAMYVMSQLLRPWISRSLKTHLGGWPFAGDYGPIVLAASMLLVLWLFCYWMYRQRIFLRI